MGIHSTNTFLKEIKYEIRFNSIPFAGRRRKQADRFDTDKTFEWTGKQLRRECVDDFIEGAKWQLSKRQMELEKENERLKEALKKIQQIKKTEDDIRKEILEKHIRENKCHHIDPYQVFERMKKAALAAMKKYKEL